MQKPFAAVAALLVSLVSTAAAAPGQVPPRFVFASARTGASEVYSVAASGGRLSQLTFGRREVCAPRSSPDGRLVAYVVAAHLDEWGDTRVCVGALWVARADGRGPHELAADAWGAFAWSPDSRRIAYGGSKPAGLWVTPVAAGARLGGTRLTSTDGGQPAWSPDGRSLAFVRSGRVSSSLVVWHGGRERVIADDIAGPVGWSANGAWIAFRYLVAAEDDRSYVGVVRVDGSDVHGLAAADSFVWAPVGAELALSNDQGVSVVTTRRIISTLSAEHASSIAWSPTGDELAIIDTRERVLRLRLKGTTTVVYAGSRGDSLESLSWTRPPPGLHPRTTEKLQPLEAAGPRELRARYDVQALGAEGDRAIYVLCDIVLAVWRPGKPQVTPIGDHRPTACRHQYSRGFIGAPTLAGDRAAWVRGGSGLAGPVLQVESLAGGATTTVTHGDDPRKANGTQVGYLLGAGSDLLYSSWAFCRPHVLAPGACSGDEIGIPTVSNLVSNQAILRLNRTTPAQIAQASGAYEPLALAGGRLVVRRHVSGVDILDPNGDKLLSIETGTTVLAAELSGDDLVVLVRGELRDYDAQTGTLTHAWPLPAAANGAWLYCGYVDGCSHDVALVGVAGGRAI
jgi:hypothetical protein